MQQTIHVVKIDEREVKQFVCKMPKIKTKPKYL